MASETLGGSPTEQTLLELLYQCPVAIVQTTARGSVELMNAHAANLLCPRNGGAPVDNLFEFLRGSSDSLETLCLEHSTTDAVVAHNLRICLSAIPEVAEAAWFSFNVVRVADGDLVIAFMDVTDIVKIEDVTRIAGSVEAMQRGRVDVVATVLEDIDDAMTNVATRIGKMLGAHEWAEVDQLAQIQRLLMNEKSGLEKALGAECTADLLEACEAVHVSLERRSQAQAADVACLHEASLRVLEILAIRRGAVLDR